MLGLTLLNVLLALATPHVRADDPASVPLEVLRTRHVAVQTKINGEGPFRLVLDTGAPITFINRRVAVKLGLMKPDAAKQPAMLGMGGQVKVRSLEVGSVKAEDVPVMILDHPIVEMIGQVEGGIDGIVGYTFWARYRMTLDYQAKQATFASSDYKPQDVLASVMARLMNTDDRAPVISPAGLWGMEAAVEKGKVVVKRVTPGWPAAQAGLRPGDRIKTINRRWTDTFPELLDALAHARPDQPAAMVIDRSGTEVRVEVRPRTGL